VDLAFVHGSVNPARKGQRTASRRSAW
jgi:hypothetical protein